MEHFLVYIDVIDDDDRFVIDVVIDDVIHELGDFPSLKFYFSLMSKSLLITSQ